ncbi:hypothetical protein ABTF51_19570, partial [Acinetobacter baumannii]
MAYTDWVNSIGPSAEQAQITAIIRRVVVHVVLNFCVIAAIFIASAYLSRQTDIGDWLQRLPEDWRVTAFWGMTLVVALPFMVAAYRKLEALALILVELSVGGPATSPARHALRSLFARALPAAAL